MRQIKITHDTWGKAEIKQATDLPINLKFALRSGQVLNASELSKVGGHYKVVVSFYLWGGHFEELTPVAARQAPPKEINLAMPYHSQLNNRINPYGSCNVTSVAMVLRFLGTPLPGDGEQLEDKLYKYLIDKGLNPQSPIDLDRLIKDWGYGNRFDYSAKWDDVKLWLLSGKPCICHGYFTRAGHIVVIKGFNDRGWICHDPYGLWRPGGYDLSVGGADVVYSYKDMEAICSPDNDLWIHFCGGPND